MSRHEHHRYEHSRVNVHRRIEQARTNNLAWVFLARFESIPTPLLGLSDLLVPTPGRDKARPGMTKTERMNRTACVIRVLASLWEFA